MKVIFAQGNPETRYTNTRHNVGWVILDAYAHSLKVEFVAKPKFFASVAELTLNGEKVLLIKPTTYYNETGRSSRAILDFYKLASNDILVLHDELSLAFGTLRIREKGRDAGNNGIKSLNAHIGENYIRLRVGVDNELHARMNDSDFVLSNFSKEEQEYLDSHIIPKALTIIDDFISGNHQTTSHTLLIPQ